MKSVSHLRFSFFVFILISSEIKLFGKMSMLLKDLSKQMLTTQLRELENDGIIDRKIYPEIPPRVEYFLSEKGKTLLPIIELMRVWGNEHLLAEKDA